MSQKGIEPLACYASIPPDPAHQPLRLRDTRPWFYRSNYAKGCLALSFCARISSMEGFSANALWIDSLVAR